MDSRSKHDEIRSKRVKDSGTWLLESEKFVNWLKESSSMLYCKGPGVIPYSDVANSLAGVGKSFLTFCPKQVVLTLDLLSSIILRNTVPKNRITALPTFTLTIKVKKVKMIGASPLVFSDNWSPSYLKSTNSSKSLTTTYIAGLEFQRLRHSWSFSHLPQGHFIVLSLFWMLSMNVETHKGHT
jgi:hypothetical protein